jgi:hypothetical protein
MRHPSCGVNGAKGLVEIPAAVRLDDDYLEKVRRFGVEDEHLRETSIQGPWIVHFPLNLGYSSFWWQSLLDDRGLSKMGESLPVL